MSTPARHAKTALKAALLALALGGSVQLEGATVRGALVSEAQAVVGRPLTPVSVAGVARRTTRRTIRRTAVYASTLPRGCSTVTVNGVGLHQCGGTYYQASGTQYVVVEVD